MRYLELTPLAAAIILRLQAGESLKDSLLGATRAARAELYDATRSAWTLGKDRKKARYAFAVFEGVIREVYRIESWLPGGRTFAAQNGGKLRRRPGRSEFVGTLAADEIRRRYVNRYVGDEFVPGSQNPVKYVNIKKR